MPETDGSDGDGAPAEEGAGGESDVQKDPAKEETGQPAPAVRELETSDPAVLIPAARGKFEAKASGSLLVLSGLAPGEKYQVFLHSTPVKIGTLPVDTNGLLPLTIPAELEAGDHRVALYNLDGTLAGWQSFTVQPAVTVLGAPAQSTGTAPAALAETGATGAQLLVGGAGVLMALAGGAALVALRLQNRRSEGAAGTAAMG